jgi:hypothetical protein
VRLLHWHWPPGLSPTSSVVPVVIVVALLVGTWAVRHRALLRLVDRPELRGHTAERRRPATSAESVLVIPTQSAAPTTTRHSHANQSPQRV